METKLDNKLAMYRAVISLLTASAAIIGEVAALVTKLATLKTKVGNISVLAATQALPASGVVASKEKALDEMAVAALDVAGSVLSYATEKGLHELAAKVTVSETQVRHGRQQDRVVLAQQIHDAAAPVVTLLADYGLTAEKQTDLQAKIVTATAALSGPRAAVASRKAATEQLSDAFKEVDTLLEKEIDPLMVKFHKTQPEFYADYKAMRTIIDRPGGRGTEKPAPANVASGTTPVAT